MDKRAGLKTGKDMQAPTEGLEQQREVRGARSHVPVLLRHGRRLGDGGQGGLLAHQGAHVAAFENVCNVLVRSFFWLKPHGLPYAK